VINELINVKLVKELIDKKIRKTLFEIAAKV